MQNAWKMSVGFLKYLDLSDQQSKTQIFSTYSEKSKQTNFYYFFMTTYDYH